MQKKKKNLHGKVVIPSEWNVLTYLEKKIHGFSSSLTD